MKPAGVVPPTSRKGLIFSYANFSKENQFVRQILSERRRTVQNKME